jgi:demethylmenaquinone methyltransferase / 2-methoxy-6-polyprenyl-1,4-benzoquinol methylase
MTRTGSLATTADERPAETAVELQRASSIAASDGPPSVPPIPSPGVRPGNPVPEPDVSAMFDDIAPVYDRLNTIMTFGADARWRRAAVDAAAISSGSSVIDVACGTGKLAAALAERVGPFGRVLGVDLAPGMIAHGAQTFYDIVQLEFRIGNALDLPVGDGEFDAATIAFGLRNLADYEAGFRELRRVVRPGGRIVCLELTTPRPRWWGRVFRIGFGRAAPLLGRMVRREAAYRYLPTSLDGFPPPDGLAATMGEAGLEHVGFRRMGLGAVALHTGVVPESGSART